MAALRGRWVGGPGKEVVCVVVVGIWEAGGCGGCVGDDGGVLSGAERGEFAG